AAWYLRHWKDAWQHVKDASSSDLALNYGARDTIVNKLVIWWRLLLQSFTSPYLSRVFLACVVIAIVYIATRRKRSGLLPRFHPVAALSVAQIVLMLLVFASNIAVDSRYMFALSPFLAILFMQLSAWAPPRLLPALLLAVAAQWASVNAVSLGIGVPLAEPS